ncbi:MAG: Gfo/Idh/MocA family oxidoreductase [Defluviitaleaceae bacterium]|nr:Gfo/Idh/MocA family oxidoreductase [Defluviitaleaceae bacterium]
MHKIIIAGCGMVANSWIDVALARKDCQIVALVNRSIDRANAKKAEYNLPARTYTSLETALEKEDANLVFDLTAPESHYHIVTTALQAGCHVFGEKPMSDTLANAEKMVMAAEETGREYFVMQNRRYVPGIVSLRNFLNAGKGQLGAIGQVSASFQLDPHFGGFREDMDSPLLADMAIHTFDAARFITGKSPVSVYCHEYNPPWSWYKGSANAVCIFEMEDGSVFNYNGSWCANGMNTSWESEWRVACAKGAAFWDGNVGLYYDLTSTGPPKTGLASENEITANYVDIPIAPQPRSGHDLCITEMFEALNSGTRPQTDCRDNIKSIRMVYKAIESARLRKLIAL